MVFDMGIDTEYRNNGETNPLHIAALALRAIYVMTNDVTMEIKMKEVEEQIK